MYDMQISSPILCEFSPIIFYSIDSIFWYATYLIFMKSNLSTFSIVACVLVWYSRNHCQIQVESTMISTKSFIMSSFTFRSWIPPLQFYGKVWGRLMLVLLSMFGRIQ